MDESYEEGYNEGYRDAKKELKESDMKRWDKDKKIWIRPKKEKELAAKDEAIAELVEYVQQSVDGAYCRDWWKDKGKALIAKHKGE